MCVCFVGKFNRKKNLESRLYRRNRDSSKYPNNSQMNEEDSHSIVLVQYSMSTMSNSSLSLSEKEEL